MAAVKLDSGRSTGKSFLQIAREHTGERYVLGVLAPKDNPDWKGPWDCAEFVAWVNFQVTGRLYGCKRNFGDPATADSFTGYWERDASELGEVISIDRAARTAGAVVLRVPAPGAFGHVVISDGLGGTVEAHSPTDGVIQSKLASRRWTTGILIPGVRYAEGDSVTLPAAPATIYRLTMPLMTGEAVRAIQGRLLAAGFDPGVRDREFGPHTQAAVVAFQLANGLAPDGEVGAVTAKALGFEIKTLARMD